MTRAPPGQQATRQQERIGSGPRHPARAGGDRGDEAQPHPRLLLVEIHRHRLSGGRATLRGPGRREARERGEQRSRRRREGESSPEGSRRGIAPQGASSSIPDQGQVRSRRRCVSATLRQSTPSARRGEAAEASHGSIDRCMPARFDAAVRLLLRRAGAGQPRPCACSSRRRRLGSRATSTSARGTSSSRGSRTTTAATSRPSTAGAKTSSTTSRTGPKPRGYELDALTSATPATHIALDSGAIDVTDLPDGTYSVELEMAECEVADSLPHGAGRLHLRQERYGGDARPDRPGLLPRRRRDVLRPQRQLGPGVSTRGPTSTSRLLARPRPPPATLQATASDDGGTPTLHGNSSAAIRREASPPSATPRRRSPR